MRALKTFIVGLIVVAGVALLWPTNQPAEVPTQEETVRVDRYRLEWEADQRVDALAHGGAALKLTGRAELSATLEVERRGQTLVVSLGDFVKHTLELSDQALLPDAEATRETFDGRHVVVELNEAGLIAEMRFANVRRCCRWWYSTLYGVNRAGRGWPFIRAR